MKILAISHAYVEPFTRIGLFDPKEYSDVELLVVVPKFSARKYPQGFKKLIEEGYRVKTITTIFNFHQSVRMYLPSLFFVILNMKPDIIFINNEPWSTTAFQVVLFCRFFIQKTKIVIYTSENLVRKYPIPFRWWEKFVLKNVNLVCTPTQKDGVIVLRKKGYKGKIVYLPLFVDTEFFTQQNVVELKKSIVGDNKIVIGYVGRLRKEKGVDLLLKAVKELKFDFHVLIIGSGPEKKYLCGLMEKLNLTDKVTFLHHIFYTELPKYFNCIDILVVPSRTVSNWKEQFGRVIIEAMACEIPVIGSSSGEIPNVIGDAGLIFTENSVEDLAKKISLLVENENLRQQLKTKGRKRVISNYDKKTIMRQTYNIYQSLLHESNY